MFKVVDDQEDCLPDNFDRNVAVECQEYVYDASVFEETLATKLDLVCGREGLQKLLGTFVMFGLLVGSLFGGWAGDYFGRRKVMLAVIPVMSLGLFVNAFVESYWQYAALHLIYCSGTPVLWINSHTLSLEFFSSGHKKILLCAKVLQISTASMSMVLLAFAVRHWQHQHLVLGAIGVLTFLVCLALPESPRWLAQVGRVEEAHELMVKIARVNKKQLSVEDSELISTFLRQVSDKAKESNAQTASILELLHPHFLLTTITLTLCWVMGNVGTYALSMNAAQLHGNVFLNYALTFFSNMQSAAFLWIVVDRSGRKRLLALTGLAVGLCCLTLAAVPKDQTALILVFFLLGNLLCTANLTLCWFMSTDFYPTSLRSQASGLSSTVARACGMVVPFISNLGALWPPLPMVVLGAPFLVLSVLIWLTLPEITDRELPQTTEEAIALHKRDNATTTV